MKNHLLFFCAATVLFPAAVSAQISSAPKEIPVLRDSTNGEQPKDIEISDVKGTIANKAIYLAKPAYSAEARQAGAEGIVRVKIVIGEEGSVIEANMVEGDRLLKSAAEDAAKKSRFRIMRDAGGIPIKTEGFLTYNFVIPKAGWSRIAHALSLLDRLPAASFQIPSAKKSFAPEWKNELKMLEQLEEIRRAEPSLPTSPFADAPKPVLAGNGNSASSATIVRRLHLPPAPSAEQIALSQNLISALQSRLGNDLSASWQFNLGLDLRRAMEVLRNPNNSGESAQIIRQNIENAPASISKEVIAALENLAQIFAQKMPAVASSNEIGKNLSVIFNAK